MRQTQHGVVMKEEGQQRGTWSSPPRACSAGYTGAPLPPPCAPSPTSLIALGRLRLVPGDLVTAVIYERCDMVCRFSVGWVAISLLLTQAGYTCRLAAMQHSPARTVL